MAARFDGSSDQLSISTTIGPATTGASFCGWLYVVGLRSDWTSTMGLVSASGFLNVNITPANEFLFDSSGGGVTTGHDVVAGVWYFIAGTMSSGGAMTFYVAEQDDVTLTSYTGSGSVGAGLPWVIGNSAFGEWLNGRIAYARVWTAALSEAELLTERTSTSAARTADLWADWPLDDDPNDISGNGRNLTAGGTVTWEASPDIGGPEVKDVTGTISLALSVLGSVAKTAGTAGAISLNLGMGAGNEKTANVSGSIGIGMSLAGTATKVALADGSIALVLGLSGVASIPGDLPTQPWSMLYVGSQPAARLYVGSALVWEAPEMESFAAAAFRPLAFSGGVSVNHVITGIAGDQVNCTACGWVSADAHRVVERVDSVVPEAVTDRLGPVRRLIGRFIGPYRKAWIAAAVGAVANLAAGWGLDLTDAQTGALSAVLMGVSVFLVPNTPKA